MKEKFTDVDLIDETGASRHAIAAWRKELVDQGVIVSCGIRMAGDKSLPLFEFNKNLVSHLK